MLPLLIQLDWAARAVTQTVVLATYFPSLEGPSQELVTLEGPSQEFVTLEGSSQYRSALEG